jgi:2-C-methyl-D-erythritol 4-phosphate cytidylyltransferase
LRVGHSPTYETRSPEVVMSRVAVVVPAAGKSSRFGGVEKKPFVSLDGRPVWLRAVEPFWTRPDVSRVYVVVSPDDRDEFRGRFGYLLAFQNAEVVGGGVERFESVANALARIPPEVEFVAVHDAVRPLVTPAQIDAVFAAAVQHGAAMLAVPVADTLKRVDSGLRITETIARAGLWQAQTPQVFRRDWLTEAYSKRHELSAAITDDSQLMEAAGRAVHVVAGSPANFKITTRDDLQLAEAVLKARAPKPEDAPRPRAFDDEAKW